MKKTTMQLLAVAAALLLLTAGLTLRAIRNTHVEDCLRDFTTDLRPGTPRPAVVRLLQQARQKHKVAETSIATHNDHDPKTWTLLAPDQFGATNWIVDLEFDENEQLTHRRVRTADSSTRKPDSAPSDF